MRYMMILLAIGLMVGCATQQTITSEELRIHALIFCNSAGFEPETEAHANCMMFEFQRVLNGMNAYNAQQRAAAAQAWSQGMNSMSDSFYRQSEIYSRPTTPNYQPNYNRPGCKYVTGPSCF